MPDLDRLRAAARVPDQQFPFFGADPVHTRASEDRDQESCPKCGGARVAPNGRVISNAGDADPVRDYESCVTQNGVALLVPMTVLCGSCLRSLYDGSRAMSEAHKPPIEDTASVAIESDEPVTEDGFPLAASPKGTVLFDPRQEHRDHMPRGRLKGGLGDRPPRRQDKKRKVKRY